MGLVPGISDHLCQLPLSSCLGSDPSREAGSHSPQYPRCLQGGRQFQALTSEQGHGHPRFSLYVPQALGPQAPTRPLGWRLRGHRKPPACRLSELEGPKSSIYLQMERLKPGGTRLSPDQTSGWVGSLGHLVRSSSGSSSLSG